jgi:hypothetical protein
MRNPPTRDYVGYSSQNNDPPPIDVDLFFGIPLTLHHFLPSNLVRESTELSSAVSGTIKER